MNSTCSKANWLAKVLPAAVVATVLVSAVRPETPARSIALGGVELGESLSDFTKSFLRAVCGSPLHFAEILNGFPDEDDFVLTGGCIDGPEETSVFSHHKILFLASCRVLATLNHEQLAQMRYVVDVPSINQLLPEFEETYGPIMFDRMMAFDGIHRKRIVAWSRSDDMLILNSVTLSGKALKSDATLDRGLEKVDVVLVHLWKMPLPKKAVN